MITNNYLNKDLHSDVDVVTLKNYNFNQLHKLIKSLWDTYVRCTDSTSNLPDKSTLEALQIMLQAKIQNCRDLSKDELEKLLFLSEQINKICEISRRITEISKSGGRKKQRSNLMIKKPNHMITCELNTPLLFNYYSKKNPNLLENLDLDERTKIITSKAFYNISGQYSFFEDGLLALARREKPKLENYLGSDYYTFRIKRDQFFELAGAIGAKKKRLNDFLLKIFTGEEVMRAIVWKRNEENGIDIYNIQIVGITFKNDELFIGLEKDIFKTVIESKIKNTSGYISYPERLEKRLVAATPGRYIPHIRPLFDFLLREFENKNFISKPTALIMASIGYSRAFKNLIDFSIHKTYVKEFLEKAIPAINQITIKGKRIITWEFSNDNSVITVG